MTKAELTKYTRLQKETKNTAKDADKAQGASTDYFRKIYKIKNPTTAQKKKVQNLVNAGFRAEYIASKKSGEYDAYKRKMIKKYTPGAGQGASFLNSFPLDSSLVSRL